MIRADQLKAIETAKEPWDIVIIGGGASGLGAALDGASRGHKTLLLEKSDFAFLFFGKINYIRFF